MVLTEQVARTKECMFVRVQLYAPDMKDNPPVNRTSADFNCRASDCMHWRWWGKTTQGYCGLAGRPEREG